MSVPKPYAMFELAGKVAIVTGGSRGLGREIALAYARAGADIVVTSRKIAECRKVAEEIESETGRSALAHACHVGHWDELPELVEASYERFGHVDVLVNNAGVSPRYDSLDTVTEKLVDTTLDVNLKGPLRLASLVAPRMIEAGGGVIINVSSAASLRPDPSFVVYAAAKAALNSLTDGLARAYAPTVRVNCLVPGAFKTDMANAWTESAVAEFAKTFALGRAAAPSEIVGAALFLASDASSFTTGSLIRADGLPL